MIRNITNKLLLEWDMVNNILTALLLFCERDGRHGIGVNIKKHLVSASVILKSREFNKVAPSSKIFDLISLD